MSRTNFATKNGIPLRFSDTSDTIHHIDVFNQYIANNYQLLGMDAPEYIDSTSELYTQLLDIVHEYAFENPENGVTLHGLHYIYKECVQDYLAFMLPKVVFTPASADIEEEVPQERPDSVRDSDIYVSTEFLRRYVQGYSKLTRHELSLFDEYKDMYHDKYYGHISRFNELASDYITKNKDHMKMFVADLSDAVDTILSNRKGRRDTRYVRSACY